MTLIENLAPVTTQILAAKAQQVRWPMRVPQNQHGEPESTLSWSVSAKERDPVATEEGMAVDTLTVSQNVLTANPIQAQQATLIRVGERDSYGMEIAPPANALKDDTGAVLGHLAIQLRSSLAGNMPEVRRWLSRRTYTSYEQRISKAAGLRDLSRWNHVLASIDAYLDRNGLIRYFPSTSISGSDVLTAYVLSVADELAQQDARFTLPETAKQRMLSGLQQVALGKIKPEVWDANHRGVPRQLMVLEALARYNMAQATMLDNMTMTPERWSVEMLVDWLRITDQITLSESMAEQRQHVVGLLRSALTERGTVLVVSDTEVAAPWLMRSDVTAQARLLLWARTQADWGNDVARLMQGLVAKQKNGRWRTTTENVWATIALQGRTSTALTQSSISVEGEDVELIDWTAQSATEGVKAVDLDVPWTTSTRRLSVDNLEGGELWVLLRSLASVPVTKAVESGYALQRELSPVSQRSPERWAVGTPIRCV